MFATKARCAIVLLLISAVQALAEDNLQLPSLSSQSVSVVGSDKTYSVECFLGNPSDKQSQGSITVTSAADAGPLCNQMYFSCKGRCFGCFSDFDYSDDLCVDNAGRKYLR